MVSGAGELAIRNYAVAAGDRLEDSWRLGDFADGVYHLRVHGPNGFLREFRGSRADPPLEIRLEYAAASKGPFALDGNLEVKAANRDARRAVVLELADRSYQGPSLKRLIAAGQTATLAVDTQRSFCWYDVVLASGQFPHFEQRFAGHVETGAWSRTDPAMGQSVG